MDRETKQTNELEAKLPERLKNVRVGIRTDLEVVRIVFKNQPHYIVRDPLTFQNFKLDLKGYRIFTSITRDKPLALIFKELVKSGVLTEDEEVKFYKLIFTLHSLNFLNLPIANDKALYRRYLIRKKAQLKAKLMGFMFFKLPLLNPDSFLDATIHLVRFIFTPLFFICWLILIMSACGLIYKNIEAFIHPLKNLNLVQHAVYIWTILIVLKVFHEFGHAYACKHFGGNVPEMGAFFVLFTPLAYVDATSSWSFPRKRDRIIVALAGMYVELIFAAIATFVWFFSEPGPVKDIAYYVVFIAGIATVLFNFNPLARFDGYYALSDFLEIPNLRKQATQYIASVFKKIFLGITKDNLFVPARTAIILFIFGIASIIYRTSIILAICFTASVKLSFIGLLLSAFFLTSYFGSRVLNFIKYLLKSPETAPVRVKSTFYAILIFIIIPLLAFTVPLPDRIQPIGFIEYRDQIPISARVAGFIKNIATEPGHWVDTNAVLIQLENDKVIDAYNHAKTQYQVAKLRHTAFQNVDIVQAKEESARIRAYLYELKVRKNDLENLTIKTPISGKVTKILDKNTDIGKFVDKGSLLAIVGTGPWVVRTYLTERDFVKLDPKIGDLVDVIFYANPAEKFVGIVKRITPAGTEVGKNPKKPSKEQIIGFEIEIELTDTKLADWLKDKMTCKVIWQGTAEPIGKRIYRTISYALAKLTKTTP